MIALVLLLLGGFGVAQAHPPTMAQATAANLPAQRIGANDLLAVSVYDSPEFTRTVRVSMDGEMRLPMMKNRIQAKGLLPAELETRVADALRSEQLLVDPIVTITVAEYHSRPISVAGAVKTPATFQAVGPMTLLDALTRAGGLSIDAGTEILVSRQQEGADGTPATFIQRIPVRGLINDADPELNITLVGGEEIRVPEVGKIFVVGNVTRPGAFPVQDTSETTVLQMLALAEGLAPYAGKEAYIYRRDTDSGAKHEIGIELKKIMQRKAPDVPLQANDILYIPDNSGRRAAFGAIEKIAGFAASTASGLLIWRR